MNVVVMMGRMTRDAEVRYTNDKAVANFAIAVDKRFKKDEADFFECVAWGKTAEFIEKYLGKGRKVAVTGRLENDKWTDREGNNRVTTKIICDTVDFADAKPEGRPEAPDDGFIDVPKGIDEELPFN